MKELYSIGEVSDVFGVSSETIQTQIRKGNIVIEKIKNKHRISSLYVQKLRETGTFDGMGKQGPIKCECCGREFRRRTSEQRFCSSTCRLPLSRFRFIIMRRDGFRCIYCGQTPSEYGVFLTIDHILPISSGGKTIPANLGTACLECNACKSSNLLPPEVEVYILKQIAKRNKTAKIDPDEVFRLAERRG